MYAGGAAPWVRAGRRRPGGQDGGEFLSGPVGLSAGFELLRQRVAQLHQHLDVECRVEQPVAGQRPGGPIGRRVALLQRQPEHFLDQGAESHPRVAEQPPGQLGVEQAPGPVADLRQAGQVLRRRVQHSLRIGQRAVYAGQVGTGHRVDQHRSGAAAPELDQEGPAARSGSRRHARHRRRPGRCPPRVTWRPHRVRPRSPPAGASHRAARAGARPRFPPPVRPALLVPPCPVPLCLVPPCPARPVPAPRQPLQARPSATGRLLATGHCRRSPLPPGCPAAGDGPPSPVTAAAGCAGAAAR